MKNAVNYKRHQRQIKERNGRDYILMSINVPLGD